MQILKKSQHTYTDHYALAFTDPNDPGCGCWFDCDKDGNLFPLEPAAQKNYEDCLNGTRGYVSTGMKHWVQYSFQPPVGKCSCGEVMELYHPATNECPKCGNLYNGFGQDLAPRSQWEWECDNDVSPEDWVAL